MVFKTRNMCWRLLLKLARNKVKGNWWFNMDYSSLSGQNNMRWNEQHYEQDETRNAIPQGGVASPILFLLIVNDLINVVLYQSQNTRDGGQDRNTGDRVGCNCQQDQQHNIYIKHKRVESQTDIPRWTSPLWITLDKRLIWRNQINNRTIRARNRLTVMRH